MAKSPAMIAVCFTLWGLLLWWQGPRLWGLVLGARSAGQEALLICYAVLVALFWLLGAYYTAVVAFALLPGRLPELVWDPSLGTPRVAVLYPTCDDFQYEAARSCVLQDYPEFHVFLLDDSSAPEYRAKVDAFHHEYAERTTVVRRVDRFGGKAGNLNHALRGAAAGFQLLAVADADERLPTGFLRSTVPYLVGTELAFAQANHVPNPTQATRFSAELGPTILPFWDVHCRPRNRYGFVPYVAHGVLLSRTAWEAVGGFPHAVGDDLAFSAVLAAAGWRGIFLDHVVCQEDFAGGYRAFKRQHERHLIGATEVLREYLPPLLRSRRLSLTEKLDLCLWCSPLYGPALCLLFAVVLLSLTAIFGEWRALHLSVNGQQLTLGTFRMPAPGLDYLWSRQAWWISLACALSPMFAVLCLSAQRKMALARTFFLSTAPYLSLMVVSWRGILRYLVLGHRFFTPTGQAEPSPAAPPERLPGGAESGPGGRPWSPPSVWELAIGVILGGIALCCLNIGFFAICSCLSFGVLADRYGWEAWFVRAVGVACAALILAHLAAGALCLGQWTAFPPLPFAVHF